MTILADEFLTARKEHRCSGCGGVIGVGDRYHRQRVVAGAEAWTAKTHGLCLAIGEYLHDEMGLLDDEWPYEDNVREGLAEWFAVLSAPPTDRGADG